MTASEVAQLKKRIAEEYTAAGRGLTGLSSGSARHAFITARLDNVGVMHEQLMALVGQDEATKIIVEAVWLPTDREVVTSYARKSGLIPSQGQAQLE